VAVKEWNDEIIFVRQVTPGASERSFGIQVARLAGLPQAVVQRAKEILAGLEGKASPATADHALREHAENEADVPPERAMPVVKKKRVSPPADPSQLELF